MTDPERQSRTLREARRGQREVLAAIVAVVVSLWATVANAGYWLQVAGAVAGLFILVVTWPRWGRVRRYKRADLVTKVQDDLEISRLQKRDRGDYS